MLEDELEDEREDDELEDAEELAELEVAEEPTELEDADELADVESSDEALGRSPPWSSPGSGVRVVRSPPWSSTLAAGVLDELLTSWTDAGTVVGSDWANDSLPSKPRAAGTTAAVAAITIATRFMVRFLSGRAAGVVRPWLNTAGHARAAAIGLWS